MGGKRGPAQYPGGGQSREDGGREKKDIEHLEGTGPKGFRVGGGRLRGGRNGAGGETDRRDLSFLAVNEQKEKKLK